MSASVEVEVVNPSGIHARPAAAFFKEIRKFNSSISVENLTKGTAPVDARRSFIEVIAKLSAAQGHRIRITATGDDEAAAAQALGALVESGLGEGRPTA